MHSQTYLPTSIHLLSLAVNLRQLKLRSSGWIGNRDIELEIEFVFEKVVNIPTLASPTRALRIGSGDTEPVIVVGLVHLGIRNQRLVLLFQPLRPCRAVSWTRLCRQKRYSR